MSYKIIGDDCTKTLMVQGTSSGSGKTTLVIALCRIFKNLGYTVAPFKSQNMSNHVYQNNKIKISVAQAIQAIAAKTKIQTDMNPILLKPIDKNISSVFLHGKFYQNMEISYYYKNFIKQGLQISIDSLNNLKKKYDLIIIEGAGSPAEINLQKFDITNMKIASLNNSPTILITDIYRGGSFASLAGTINLLNKKHRLLIKGFVFNKFIGNIDILKPGFNKLEQKTKKHIIGVIPKFDFKLPEEDSLDNINTNNIWNEKQLKNFDIAIDHLSNIVKSNLDMKYIFDIMQ